MESPKKKIDAVRREIRQHGIPQKRKSMLSEGRSDSIESPKKKIDAARSEIRQHGILKKENRCCQK
ncbi:hypothetical protein ACQUWN_17625 [Rossellomorea aquimaris]|uniref:hypothetical protein n=1 Tax=Rossellomorea aquimaris TaxID=189382 RepID=UPI003D186270